MKTEQSKSLQLGNQQEDQCTAKFNNLIAELLSAGIIGGPEQQQTQPKIQTSLVKEELEKNLNIKGKILCKYCQDEFQSTQELQSHLIKKITQTHDDWKNKHQIYSDGTTISHQFYQFQCVDWIKFKNQHNFYQCPRCWTVCKSVEQLQTHMMKDEECHLQEYGKKVQKSEELEKDVDEEVTEVYNWYCNSRLERLLLVLTELQNIPDNILLGLGEDDILLLVQYKMYIEQQTWIEETTLIIIERLRKQGINIYIPPNQHQLTRAQMLEYRKVQLEILQGYANNMEDFLSQEFMNFYQMEEIEAQKKVKEEKYIIDSLKISLIQQIRILQQQDDDIRDNTMEDESIIFALDNINIRNMRNIIENSKIVNKNYPNSQFNKNSQDIQRIFEKRTNVLQVIADKTIKLFGQEISTKLKCVTAQEIRTKMFQLTQNINIENIDDYFNINIPQTLKKFMNPFVYEASLLKFYENKDEEIIAEIGKQQLIRSNLFNRFRIIIDGWFKYNTSKLDQDIQEIIVQPETERIQEIFEAIMIEEENFKQTIQEQFIIQEICNGEDLLKCVNKIKTFLHEIITSDLLVENQIRLVRLLLNQLKQLVERFKEQDIEIEIAEIAKSVDIECTQVLLGLLNQFKEGLSIVRQQFEERQPKVQIQKPNWRNHPPPMKFEQDVKEFVQQLRVRGQNIQRGMFQVTEHLQKKIKEYWAKVLKNRILLNQGNGWIRKLKINQDLFLKDAILIKLRNDVVPQDLTFIPIIQELITKTVTNSTNNGTVGGGNQEKSVFDRWATDVEIMQVTQDFIQQNAANRRIILVDPQLAAIDANWSNLPYIDMINNYKQQFNDDNCLLLFPMVISNHWICVSATFQKGQLFTYYFDSQKEQQEMRQEAALIKASNLIQQLMNTQWSPIKNMMKPKVTADQQDNYSCGYYVMLYMQRIILGEINKIHKNEAIKFYGQIRNIEENDLSNLNDSESSQISDVSVTNNKNKYQQSFKCPFCDWADPFESFEDLQLHVVRSIEDNRHKALELWKSETMIMYRENQIQKGNYQKSCLICECPLKKNCSENQHQKSLFCKQAKKELQLACSMQKVAFNKRNTELFPETKHQLSMNCTQQDKDGLLFQANILNQKVKSKPQQLLSAFQEFLGQFSMTKQKGQPKWKSDKQEQASLRKYADLLEEVEGISKLYQRIEQWYDKKGRTPQLSEEEQLKLFNEYHPQQKTTDLGKQDNSTTKQQFEEIKYEDVSLEIKHLQKHKSCGPSGIGPTHLKFLNKKSKEFISLLTKLFNYLMNYPENMPKIRLLYQFRAIFIPKDNGGHRPIAICETILLVFHKLMMRKLRGQSALHKNQFGFRSNANALCLARVEKLRNDGFALTTIDIKNAFNSIPHEAIMHELARQHVSAGYRKYISSFLENRNCQFRQSIQCGVPQGDSQSTQLFCLAINPIVEYLSDQQLTKKEYYPVVYIDDFVIAHPKSISKDEVVRDISNLVNKIGLEINLSKCKSTVCGEKIRFMGQDFEDQSPLTRVDQLKERITKSITMIDKAPISLQQKFKLITFVALAQVNWGPLVEQVPINQEYERNQYNLIDDQVVEYIKKLFNLELSNKEIKEIAINRKIEGGLELMLPGIYYDTMKQMQIQHLNEEQYDECSFYTLKTQYLVNRKQTEDLKSKHNNTPKFGFALYDFVKIEDNTFDYLAQIRFGVKRSCIPQQYCPFCAKVMTPDHCIVCNINHNSANRRHDNVVKAFQGLVSESKKCKVVCLNEGNEEKNRLKPDLECYIANKRCLIDVSFVYQGEGNIKQLMKTRFNQKIEKYIKCDKIYGEDQIVPIIIGYDGILYEKSAELIDQLFQEITPGSFYKAIYREIGKAWSYAQDITFNRQDDVLQRDDMPMQGEKEGKKVGQRFWQGMTKEMTNDAFLKKNMDGKIKNQQKDASFE